MKRVMDKEYKNGR